MLDFTISGQRYYDTCAGTDAGSASGSAEKPLYTCLIKPRWDPNSDPRGKADSAGLGARPQGVGGGRTRQGHRLFPQREAETKRDGGTRRCRNPGMKRSAGSERVLTQVPPSLWLSTTAARAPSSAARRALANPPEPPPITR